MELEPVKVNSINSTIPELPNSLPPSPPSLTHLPFEVLHSATVQMLRQQNQDLFSRLNVNIGLNSQLEEKILEYEKELKKLSQKKKNLELEIRSLLERQKSRDREDSAKDNEILSKNKEIISKDNEILLVKKKLQAITVQQNKWSLENRRVQSELKSKIISRQTQIQSLNNKLNRFHRIKKMMRERTEKLKANALELKCQYEEFSKKTSEENQIFKNIIDDKKNDIDLLTKKIEKSNRLKVRGKNRLRGFLLQTAQGFLSQKNQLDRSQAQNRQLNSELESLKTDLLRKEMGLRENLQEFKKKSEEKYHEVSFRNKELLLQNQRLCEIQEDLQNEVNHLNSELHGEKKNRLKLRQLNLRVNEFKNERIRLKRKMEDEVKIKEQNQQELMERSRFLEKELNKVQQTAKKREEELKLCETKLLEINKDNKELSHQLNSIQSLWLSAQEKLEKMELKNKSLEKINRELSRQFKDEKIHQITKRTMNKE